MDLKVKADVWLLVRKDGKIQPIIRGMMFIGREECDITLQSASADKRHAVIFYDTSDKEIRIKDLNSITGTYVNGVRIPEQSYIKLKHLDCVRFGYGPDVFHIQKAKDSSSAPSKNCNSNYAKENVSDKNINPTSDNSSKLKEKVISKPSKQVPSPEEDNALIHDADSLEDLRVIDSLPTPPQKSGEPIRSTDSFQVMRGQQPDMLGGQVNGEVLNTSKPTSDSSSLVQSGSPKKSEQNRDSEIENSLDTKETMPAKLDAKKNSEGSYQRNDCNLNEKQTPNESTQSSMAFTIAFDNAAPRKKPGIKTRINKYTPRKSDSERSTVSQKSKSETSSPKETHVNKISPNVEATRSKNSSERTLEDLEDGWNMTRGHNESVNSGEGQLSEGATYLIRKMLNGEPKPVIPNNKSPVISNMKSPGNLCRTNNLSKDSCLKEAKQSADCRNKNIPYPSEKCVDDKSETGTYTVESESADPVVEEARQKIDEVFGVYLPGTKGSPSYPNAEDRGKEQTKGIQYSKRLPNLSHQAGNNSDAEKSGILTSDDKSSGALIRPKRRLPVPPVLPGEGVKSHFGTYLVKGKGNDTSCNKQEYPHSFYDDGFSSNTNLYNGHLSNSLHRSRRNPLSPGPLHLDNYFSDKEIKETNLPYSQNFCGDSRYDDNPQPKTPPANIQWRKKPWNSTGSEQDLDQNKSETGSVLSDVSASTEPGSLNYPSKNKPEVQLKFNRAFALRRARLGLDTDVSSSGGKSSISKSSQDKAMSNSIHTLHPPSGLSRQDGGRFSLRLPRSTTASRSTPPSKPIRKKTSIPTSDMSSSSTFKAGHRRMDSDPGKSVLWQRKDSNRSTVSDSSKSSGLSNSFHRSSSYCSADEDEMSKSMPPRAFKHDSSKRLQPTAKSNYAEMRRKESSTECISNLPLSKYEKSKVASVIEISPNHVSNNSTKHISALDNLVITAIHQLSMKLKAETHSLLEKEKEKYPDNSEYRLVINEVLPQVMDKKASDSSGEPNLTKDLSSILKNLKRVEQSLQVLSSLCDVSGGKKDRKTLESKSFFIVDV